MIDFGAVLIKGSSLIPFCHPVGMCLKIQSQQLKRQNHVVYVFEQCSYLFINHYELIYLFLSYFIIICIIYFFVALERFFAIVF